MAHAHKLEILRGLIKFKSNTQKIWGVLILLTIVTSVEVVLGIMKPEALIGHFLGMKILNWIFIILTLVKAYYITWDFMHMRDETPSLRRMVVWTAIFLILYFQFKSVSTSLMVFTGIIVAFAGGFIMIWLYGQDWFFNFNLFGENMRDLFNMKTINLSVAVWVGFIALFGIATDDGVVMATYLTQTFDREEPTDKKGIRLATLEAAGKRIRPCLMTTVTTILALLPILTSTGKGSDIMIPMAIPIFGGMIIDITSYFLLPVLFSWNKEYQLKNANK